MPLSILFMSGGGVTALELMEEELFGLLENDMGTLSPKSSVLSTESNVRLASSSRRKSGSLELLISALLEVLADAYAVWVYSELAKLNAACKSKPERLGIYRSL